MSLFPRTEVGGISLSRMIIGTNWFLGYSHQTEAKSRCIVQHHNVDTIAAILEIFLDAGIDTIMGMLATPLLSAAIRKATDRTGKNIIVVDTPALPLIPGGLDLDAAARVLDESKALGAHFCLPHQSTTDALVDRTSRTIRQMDAVAKMIRDRGMIPGLSTHMPETPVYADETKLDVATYIQIYNAVGFLMQVEIEWVQKIIRDAAKPVITIKPMAAGRLTPLPGLAFAWSTLRDQDMVTVGALTPDEAKELVDISLALLESRSPDTTLQRTRSKRSL